MPYSSSICRAIDIDIAMFNSLVCFDRGDSRGSTDTRERRERKREMQEMVLNLKLVVALQERRRRNVRFARESDYVYT